MLSADRNPCDQSSHYFHRLPIECLSPQAGKKSLRDIFASVSTRSTSSQASGITDRGRQSWHRAAESHAAGYRICALARKPAFRVGGPAPRGGRSGARHRGRRSWHRCPPLCPLQGAILPLASLFLIRETFVKFLCFYYLQQEPTCLTKDGWKVQLLTMIKLRRPASKTATRSGTRSGYWLISINKPGRYGEIVPQTSITSGGIGDGE